MSRWSFLRLIPLLPSFLVVIAKKSIHLSLRIWKHVLLSRPFFLIWVMNLLFFELILPRMYIIPCAWPKLSKKSSLDIHALVVADPQLTDAMSYGQSGVLLWLTEFYSDIYMKRNFRLLRRVLEPHAVIYAGDLMDGARQWKDDQFQAEFNRFLNVFQTPEYPGPLTITVPGNHDIGFGSTVLQYVYERYLKHFGHANEITSLGNHTFITLDTVSLSSDNPNLSSYIIADTFLESIEAPQHLVGPSRRILISHVPLYRPEESSCGPRRRSPPIRNARGHQYQNLVQPPLTQRILEKIRPDLIISGDDHDDCVYVHKYGNGYEAVEHTIPTFSWLQGNVYPGVGVLSLRPLAASPIRHDIPSLHLNICSLPSQLFIYIWYIVLFILCLIAIPIYVYGQRGHLYSLKKRNEAEAFVEEDALPIHQRRSSSVSSIASIAETSLCDGSLFRIASQSFFIIRETIAYSLVVYLVIIIWVWRG